jgi:lysophospholipase L1-like esterase
VIKATVYSGVFLLAVSVSCYTQAALKFDFGPGKPAPGYRRVVAADVYSLEKGFGFETGAAVECFDHGGHDSLRPGFCTSDRPFYFSIAVPEGNYRVTLTLGALDRTATTTVKAELRRLMLENVETRPGQFLRENFVVNVRRPQISGGGEVRLKDREKTTEWWAWDEKLTLEFNGSRPVIDSIEIEKVNLRTIFLLGDSTVCDQPREPYASWGQMLTRFFTPRVAIANHAESGESLRSSLAAKRLDKVLSLMRPGDYLLIQYGHNDEKEKGEGVGPFTTFKRDLKYFVEEARKKGGIPILITPVQRRTFDADGKITNSHGDYPEAVRQVTKEENVPLIDLNAMSKDFYEAMGPVNSAAAFKEGDGTHHNNYGSYELAKCIVQAIRNQRLPLAKYLVKGLPVFDPKKPDSLKGFSVPASPMVTDTKPFGN